MVEKILTRGRNVVDFASYQQGRKIGAAKALELMQMDKKVLGGSVRLVLLEKLGRAVLTGDYPRTALDATLAEHFA